MLAAACKHVHAQNLRAERTKCLFSFFLVPIEILILVQMVLACLVNFDLDCFFSWGSIPNYVILVIYCFHQAPLFKIRLRFFRFHRSVFDWDIFHWHQCEMLLHLGQLYRWSRWSRIKHETTWNNLLARTSGRGGEFMYKGALRWPIWDSPQMKRTVKPVGLEMWRNFTNTVQRNLDITVYGGWLINLRAEIVARLKLNKLTVFMPRVFLGFFRVQVVFS